MILAPVNLLPKWTTGRVSIFFLHDINKLATGSTYTKSEYERI